MHILSKLKKLSNIDVRFRNTFIGEIRFLELPINGSKYYLTLHDEVKNLKPKVVFKLNISDKDAFFLVKNHPIIENINNNFKGIDLDLLPDVVRAEVSKQVYGCVADTLTSLLKLNFEIQDTSFDENFVADSEKIVGVSVLDSSKQVIIVGNLALSSELLSQIVDSFSSIPAEKCGYERDVEFSAFLEAGRTLLSQDEYRSLEENDIIFLDDASHVNSGVFDLEGIGPIKASGSFENGRFVLKNVLKK